MTVPAGTCRLPPKGWYCSLDAGHSGPCPTRVRPGPVRTGVTLAAGDEGVPQFLIIVAIVFVSGILIGMAIAGWTV